MLFDRYVQGLSFLDHRVDIDDLPLLLLCRPFFHFVFVTRFSALRLSFAAHPPPPHNETMGFRILPILPSYVVILSTGYNDASPPPTLLNGAVPPSHRYFSRRVRRVYTDLLENGQYELY